MIDNYQFEGELTRKQSEIKAAKIFNLKTLLMELTA